MRTIASSSETSTSWASTEAISSESLPGDVPISRASSEVLTRLPLWATATPVPDAVST